MTNPGPRGKEQMFLNGRPARIKGSGDHRWTEWADTPIGRPRTCLDCGCTDDGYQQPCEFYPVGTRITTSTAADTMPEGSVIHQWVYYDGIHISTVLARTGDNGEWTNAADPDDDATYTVDLDTAICVSWGYPK